VEVNATVLPSALRWALVLSPPLCLPAESTLCNVVTFATRSRRNTSGLRPLRSLATRLDAVDSKAT